MSAEADPRPPIDPVEALKRIKALVELSCEMI